MTVRTLLYWGLVGACLAACGCEPEKPKATGFLSNYSHLRPESNSKSRYLPPNYRLAQYSRFIVEPVALRLDEKTKAQLGPDTKLEELAQYMRGAIVKTLEPRYSVTTTPGPGTARLRVALTQLKKSSPLSPGGAGIEAELLDSQTNEQLAAWQEFDQVRTGGSTGLSEWDDARRVMDDWAQQLYAALEARRTY